MQSVVETNLSVWVSEEQDGIVIVSARLWDKIVNFLIYDWICIYWNKNPSKTVMKTDILCFVLFLM